MDNLATGALPRYGEKTPQTHPYGYDPFVIFEAEGEANSSAYSDRLYQWDWPKFKHLSKQVFGNVGQFWDHRSPEKIELFLQLYFEDKKLKLVTIIQYCNRASGFPVWRFDFYKSETR